MTYPNPYPETRIQQVLRLLLAIQCARLWGPLPTPEPLNVSDWFDRLDESPAANVLATPNLRSLPVTSSEFTDDTYARDMAFNRHREFDAEYFAESNPYTIDSVFTLRNGRYTG